jgi:hypothetical protein
LPIQTYADRATSHPDPGSATKGYGPAINAVTTLLRATPSGKWKFFQMQPSVVLLSRDLFLADEIERLKISGSKKETAIILYFTGVAYG